MPLGQGEILHNRYRIVRPLGQGGFGAVYRAWDLSLQRPCAVKENLESAPESQQQFEREARLLSNLTHTNLSRVTDYFFLPGQGQYLVMDYVDGADLQSMLDQEGGPLAEDRVLPWVGQVCDALTYLHGQNPPIIHRDIKPKNIIINPQNQAVLVDFGIAKVYDPSRKTTMGARAVTPGFSPIEQYGHGTTDARSDVYAIAATLYNLLTNQVPVESVNRSENPLVDPHDINPQISPGVESAILTAMELSPTQRFPGVAEFKNTLGAPQEVVIAPTAVVSGAVAQTMPAADGMPAAQHVPGTQVMPVAPAVGQGPVVAKKFPWRIVVLVIVVLMIGGAGGVFAIQRTSGWSAIPGLAAVFASKTPTATRTAEPTATSTYTVTPSPTYTSTTRPTRTPTPTRTLTPSSTPARPTATRRPTSTRAPTNTPQSTPTSDQITFDEPKKDTEHFYQGGASCGPNEITLTISANGPITDGHKMFMFWNIQDKATGESIGYNAGQIMPRIGDNTWRFTYNANTMAGTLPYQEAWYIYQFVLQGPGETKDRSPTYADVTISKCP